MVLFNILWFPRFVIELTQRWGGAVQLMSEFPNRQALNLRGLTPAFKPQTDFHFLQLIKRPLQVGSFCRVTAAWYWKNQFYLLLPWLWSLLRWRMQLKYKASKRDVKQNSNNSSKNKMSVNPRTSLCFSCYSLFLGLHIIHRKAVRSQPIERYAYSICFKKILDSTVLHPLIHKDGEAGMI